MADTRKVSLALQEGFLHDRVVIRSGTRQLAALDDLSTRVQIGLARTLELDLEEGAQLTVELPDKRIQAELKLDEGSASFVAVSVAPDGLSLDMKQTESPPFYL